MKTDDPPTLLRELRELVDLDERDQRFRSDLRALLLERARPLPAREPRPRWRVWPRLSLAVGLAGAAIATVVAVFGLAPTASNASAEAVLRHAAAVRFAADEAVHLTYNVQTTSNGRTSTGTGDVWLGTDAQGTPTLIAETLSLRKLPSAPLQLVNRNIETPAGIYTYDADNNTIEIPSRTVSSSSQQSPTVPLPAFLFNGAAVAQRLQQLGAAAQGGARLLGQRTIDGFTVDAIQVDGWPNGDSLRKIFYFDAQSHLLRGFDGTNTDPSHDATSLQARLASEQTTRADSMPSSTFKLNAPADASVQAPGAVGDVLARLCPADLKPFLAQGQSLLTACRSVTPGLTEDALVAALAESSKTDLAAAVAAGQITPDQAAQALALQQTQLRRFVIGSQPAAGSPGTATTSGGK